MERILNNGEIEFTYEEAEQQYGITAGRFVRAIDELVEKGFIDIPETGMGVHKVKTYYGISERWRDYETSSFREMHRPERSIKCGFCKGNKLWQKAKRKKSTAIRAHDRALAMRKNAHGEILAMHTDAHGQRIANRYKFCEGQWLCTKIA
jgi:DNA-binding PadR family transcriptional regulator